MQLVIAGDFVVDSTDQYVVVPNAIGVDWDDYLPVGTESWGAFSSGGGAESWADFSSGGSLESWIDFGGP
jgi:hypothetical protein